MIRSIRRKFVKALTKLYDPLVNLKIGTQTIKTPLSHQLRTNVLVYPDYNFNLPRIIKYTTIFFPDPKVIDIGANIGDTVAFIRNYSDTPVLCIDGEKKYLEILKSNVAQYKSVSICNALVGQENKVANVSMSMDRGTAVVTEATGKTTIRTLENILEEFPDFKTSKILKVDTDGYDTLILRGCAAFLKKVKPVLFF
jgi:FkbM family methyltransferase